MEINEEHADAIYEEEREKRAGVDKFTGIERPSPMPAMSPFEYVESDAEEFLEDSASKEADEYRDLDRGNRLEELFEKRAGVEKDSEDRHDSDAEEFQRDSVEYAVDDEAEEYRDRGLSRDDFV